MSGRGRGKGRGAKHQQVPAKTRSNARDLVTPPPARYDEDPRALFLEAQGLSVEEQLGTRRSTRLKGGDKNVIFYHQLLIIVYSSLLPWQKLDGQATITSGLDFEEVHPNDNAMVDEEMQPNNNAITSDPERPNDDATISESAQPNDNPIASNRDQPSNTAMVFEEDQPNGTTLISEAVQPNVKAIASNQDRLNDNAVPSAHEVSST
jgi:hypothetical protein